jgi:hypothetical protein
MFTPRFRTVCGVAAALVCVALASLTRAEDTARTGAVRLDADGVLRWAADDRELAVFGVNYCLPSASDYRAAGRAGADRAELIRQDFLHFKRLGWDGVRLSFWGDWENSDADGALIGNDHLDLLDRCLAEARRRGLLVLLSPIVVHSSLWPEYPEAPEVTGFSRKFKSSALAKDPAAIRAQARYLGELLRHVNPHTGVALKDEPALRLIELVNEPWYDSRDREGSTRYLDTLAGAVRETGWDGVVFANVSQDPGILPALRDSSVRGATFGWYPLGLLAGGELEGSRLRAVDAYPALDDARLNGLARIVYEFDAADTLDPTLYPAMARTLRGGGAQFMAMFSYDMLATAPANLGWRTHYLNLVYTPAKAVSAAIAAEVTRRVPRGADFGAYPDNNHFGPFRIEPRTRRAELNAPDAFMHTGDTATPPVEPEALRRIVGVGSSPLVAYGGLGAYFVDHLGPGRWRLELYPDAAPVGDPFRAEPRPEPVVSRLVWRERPMTLRLPGLGPDFAVAPLDAGNAHRTRAVGGTFAARPGVYLVYSGETPSRDELPEAVGGVPIDAFVCPGPTGGEPLVWPAPVLRGTEGVPLPVRVNLVADQAPAEAWIEWHAGDDTTRLTPLRADAGFAWTTTLPAEETPVGEFYWRVGIRENDGAVSPDAARWFPGTGKWRAEILAQNAPLSVLDLNDLGPARLLVSRDRQGVKSPKAVVLPTGEGGPARLRIDFPLPAKPADSDGAPAVECGVAAGFAQWAEHRPARAGWRFKVRGDLGGGRLAVRLVEADGTSWRATLPISADWAERELESDDFRAVPLILLPGMYPNGAEHRPAAAQGRGGPADNPRAAELERVQFQFVPASDGTAMATGGWVEVAAVELTVAR